MTEPSRTALEMVRNAENMQWYVVPLIVIAVYMYVTEAQQRNWSAVLLGLAYWFAEFIWEMFNALILHFSDYAPLWTTPGGNSAYIIYAGLNIEISFFFCVAALILIKALPGEKDLKILGIPNRLLIPAAMGLAGVFVEVCLNQAGLLIWDWWWWRWPHIWLIIVVYCLPFILVARLHDVLTLRAKKIGLAVTAGLALACHVVFANILHWV